MPDSALHIGAPLRAGTRVVTEEFGKGTIRSSQVDQYLTQRFYLVELDRGGRKYVHPRKLEVDDGAAR